MKNYLKKVVAFGCVAALTGSFVYSAEFTADSMGVNVINISAEENSTVVGKTYDNGSGWSFDTETGVFTVKGNGELPVKIPSVGKPSMDWNDYKDNIKEFIFEDTVENIIRYAFSNCPALEKITFPKSLKSVSTDAFSNCPMLQEVVFPEETESGELISIDSYAFMGCKGLKRIIISDTVGEICARAFHDCGDVSELYISRNAVFNGTFAFSSTNAENVFINSEEVYATNLPSNIVNLKLGNGVKTLADISGGLSAFAYSKDTLESVILEEGTQLERIGKSAFKNCTALSEFKLENEERNGFVIPDTVTSIGEDAFGSCTSITEFTFGNGIPKLQGGYIFCKNMMGMGVVQGGTETVNITKVTIPDKIELLDEGVLYGCKGLKDIYFEGMDTEITENALTINSTVFGGTLLFGKEDGQTIHCLKGSKVQEFAETYGCNYVLMDSDNTDISVMTGDANGDDEIDLRDVTALAQHIVKIKTLSGKAALNADIVKDGVIDVKDLAQLKKYLIKEISEF